MPTYVLDTSLLLGGKEPPADGPSWTTTEALREIKPGGKDARRLDGWMARGLQERGAGPEAFKAVEATSRKAGNWDRLSPADRSLLALAFESKATLVTDDFTMLDIAKRMGISSQTVNNAPIESVLDFRPRCTGCGRWYEQMRADCTVCGSPIKARPVKPA